MLFKIKLFFKNIFLEKLKKVMKNNMKSIKIYK